MGFYSQIKKKKGELFPNKDPFRKGPFGDKDDYLKIYKEAKEKKFPNVEKECKNLGVQVNKPFFDNLALVTQVVKKDSEINYQHGILLYAFLKNYIKKLEIKKVFVLETGTARGFSAICMSKAINESGCNGEVITIDYLPSDKKIFWNCIKDFEGKHTRYELLSKWEKELDNITFLTGKTKNVLSKLNTDRVNFAFLDACHTYKEVIKEYNLVSKWQLKGDIIIFDDVTPSLFPGVVEALNIIEKSKDYKIKYFEIAKDRKIAIAEKF
tara:strand:- start:598 stop:1401 length:804 start_codon:yes stop_codon:yes gene_type:complete